MNILLINTHSNGGAAKACIRLHLALLEAGASSKLLFLNKENNAIPESLDFRKYGSRTERLYLKLKGITHFLKYRKPIQKRPNGYEGFNPATSIYDITQHPAYAWADIINLHWVANFLDFASFFKKNTKPVVWTLHDMWPFTGGYHYEKGFPKKAYQTLIRKNLRIKEEALRNISLEIVTPSKWLLNKSNSGNTFTAFPHHLIPYGIDSTVYKPMAKELARELFHLPKNKKIILFVADAVHNRRKGFELLLAAFKQLSQNDLALAVIGKYQGKPLTEKNIYFLDQITNEKLMHISYSTADLYVIPSVEDNLPNTVLESLFCGTPVVGFDLGGIPDMIENGKNGWLVPEIDVDLLATTIKRALNTTFDANSIRAQAIQKYHPKVQANAYLKLFNSLVAAPLGAKDKVEHSRTK